MRRSDLFINDGSGQTVEESKLLRKALDSLADGVLVVDRNMVVRHANPQFLEMWRIPESVASSRDNELLLAYVGDQLEDPDGFVALVREVTAGNKRHSEEIRFRDGRIFSSYSAPIMVSGEHVGRVWGFHDITGRRSAETALKRSEETYRTIVNNMQDAFYRSDLTGKLLFITPSAARLLGYDSVDQMIGKDIEKNFLYNPDEQAEFFNELMLHGKMKNHEIRLKHRDGHAVTVLATSQFFYDREGRVLGLEGVYHDITERLRAERENRRLEEMLLHSQKIESIGRLAGGVAHDFNNLLTAIMGNAEMLSFLLEHSPEAMEHIQIIREAAESGSHLTRQLLAFSRKQIIEPIPMNLADVLERMRMMMVTLAGETVTLDIVPAAKDLHIIMADTGQIEQVLINLTANARDAMNGSGNLVIELSNVTLGREYALEHPYAKPGDYVMLAVSDNGSGMTPEVRSHIFEPFFTTKEKGKGTGLGLATVYGIVKQIGGSIEVYSEICRGTVFKLYFPVWKGNPDGLKVAEAPSVRNTPRGTETILVSEDNVRVRDFVRDILSMQGYTVFTSGSGEEALEIAEGFKDKIHLFLTDVVLPGINGREAADRIRSRRKEMKVLYTSGYTAEVIDRQGILEEGLTFIGKPFTALELSLKVRSVLDNG